MARPPTMPTLNAAVGWAREPLFTAEDALEAGKCIGPNSLTGDRAEEKAGLLIRAFNAAIARAAHDEESPSPRALDRYYDAVAKSARDLAENLGLPTEPARLLDGKEPLGGAWIARPPKLPRILGWLTRGAWPPTEADPPSDEPAATHAAGEFWTLAKIAEQAVSPSTLQERLTRIERYVPRGSDADRQARRAHEAIELLLSVAPHVLALIMGLSDRARLVESPIKNKANFRRSFRREVFLGLAYVHCQIYGCKPQLQNGDREPDGTGVLWAREVLRLAAKRMNDLLMKEAFATEKANLANLVAFEFGEAAALSNSSISRNLGSGVSDLSKFTPKSA